MVRKVEVILLYCIPIFLMIGLIPVVLNDYILSAIMDL